MSRRIRNWAAGGNARTNRGFVLIIVVWGIGLMSVLALSIIRSADVQSRIAANDVVDAKLEALAEAGVNIGILRLVDSRWAASTGASRQALRGDPVFCSMPGSIAAIDIEDEGGKVDLNAAPQGLLAALMTAAGATGAKTNQLAESILYFRSGENQGNQQPQAPAGPTGLDRPAAKHALFETTFEMQQVEGVSGDLLRAILPFATVHSHSSGIDKDTAPPELLQALAGGESERGNEGGGSRTTLSTSIDVNGIPPTFLVRSESNSFLVRAEILGPRHAAFVREAIVEFGADDPRRVTIREWRRGNKRFIRDLEGFGNASVLAPC